MAEEAEGATIGSTFRLASRPWVLHPFLHLPSHAFLNSLGL